MSTTRDRRAIELRIERWLDTPMLVLGVVWLMLLVLELTRGISPLLESVSDTIWMIVGMPRSFAATSTGPAICAPPGAMPRPSMERARAGSSRRSRSVWRGCGARCSRPAISDR